MKHHKQLVKHDPANGTHGDCFRTILACLLDLEPLEVPHFYESGVVEAGQRRVARWLAARGLTLVALPFDLSVNEVLGMMGVVNPRTLYMLCGRSPRGVNHVVIAHGGEIIHDANPVGGGLVSPCDDGFVWVELLVSKEVHG